MPDLPSNRRSFGCIKWLVNFQEGLFRKVQEEEMKTVKNLRSYRNHQIFFVQNRVVIKTQNCFTWGGCVAMVNPSKEELEKDYSLLEHMEKHSLFLVDPSPSSAIAAKPVGRVCVVDPFSTGAVLAYDLKRLGYAVIAVYSANLDQLANLQSLVPKGISVTFDEVLLHTDLQSLVEQLGTVEAVFAGAETGVELADLLSETLKVRTNGTALSEARRNKYAMGEAVRNSGLLLLIDVYIY